MNELKKALLDVNNAFITLLFHEVGKRLSGRRVFVYFRPPALKGARGIAFKRSGQAVIHITPGLEDVETLKVFLHEIAHILKHWEILSESPMWNMEPGTLNWTNQAQHEKVWNAEQKEDEVSRLSEQWFQYAVRHGNTLKEWLYSLLDWK